MIGCGDSRLLVVSAVAIVAVAIVAVAIVVVAIVAVANVAVAIVAVAIVAVVIVVVVNVVVVVVPEFGNSRELKDTHQELMKGVACGSRQLVGIVVVAVAAAAAVDFVAVLDVVLVAEA